MNWRKSLGLYQSYLNLKEKMKEFTIDDKFDDGDIGKQVFLFIEPQKGDIGAQLGADVLVNGIIREIYDDGFLLSEDIIKLKGKKYKPDNKILYEAIKKYYFLD